ncbi:6-bladed beta-propeller [Candidatus Nitrososphaera sp. FF02]|uniref:6-bladed beta-propeller n=1 Tax=Candidatus Nitrososphaera sp. FF02 TaxID=3398226 RepID=UPI0039ED1C92
MGTTKSLALVVALSLLASSLTSILPAFAQADTTPPTGTVSINSGAAATGSTSVTLTLSCDDGGGSGCAETKVSVDGAFDTEVFEEFATSKGVSFPSGDGVKIAMVIFKDAANNESSAFSDDIALDTSTPDAPVITGPEDGSLASSDTLEITGRVSANFVTEWGSFGTGDGEFNAPADLIVGASGTRVYVGDRDNNRVQIFNLAGTFIASFGSFGTGDGEFNGPVAIAVDSLNDIYVVDLDNNRVQKFESDGTFITRWGSSGSGDGQFNAPQDVAVDSSDNIYIADADNNRIQKFNSTGSFLAKWGTAGSGDGQFNGPAGVTVDSDDNVYVADTGNNRIQKFDSSGNFLAKWGSSGADEGEFDNPIGITVDPADNIYVIDTDNNRVQKFTGTGTFLSEWGSEGSDTGQFGFPLDLATDLSGNVYVADTDNNRIQKFEADSGDATITIFSGSEVLGAVTTRASSEWSFTSSALDDGEHELTAVAEDAAGNESDSSDIVSVLVHGSGPVQLRQRRRVCESERRSFRKQYPRGVEQSVRYVQLRDLLQEEHRRRLDI